MRWDLRFRLITVCFVILIIAILKSMTAVLASGVIISFLLAGSRTPASLFSRRILIPLLWSSPVFILLALTSGGTRIPTPLPVPLYLEGIRTACIIMLKGYSILTITLVILRGTSVSAISEALSALGAPHKLVNLIAFTWRYLFLYSENLERMKNALHLRGYKNSFSPRSYFISASLAGSLLIRSYEQTERVQDAMTLRGFTGKTVCLMEFHADIRDYIISGTVILLAAGTLVLDILL